MIPYFLTFVIAFGVCLLANYPVRRIALVRGFMDQPGERKLHEKPVPYGGGVGIFLGICAAVTALYFFYPPTQIFRNQLLGLIIGGFFVVSLGLWDDLRGSSALIKFTAQAAVALIMYYFGYRIEKISIPVMGSVNAGSWGLFITILWFWLMMNAINLIDGLDGLASGITAIAAFTILVIAFQGANPFFIFLALMVMGVSLGFLPHNFHPARQFMGDAGSLFLGFLMGALTLTSSTKAPALLTMLIPLVAMGMPVFDTGHAFLRRILSGSHPFRADKKHLHHRLLGMGLSQKRAVLILYYISAYLGVMAWVLSKAPPQYTILVVALLVIGMFLLVENLSHLKRKMHEGEKNKEN